MTVNSASIDQFQILPMVEQKVAPVDQITTETALANLKRLGEFQPNQWPFTIKQEMTLMIDPRYCQWMRSVVCDVSVFEATLQKVQKLFTEKGPEVEERQNTARKSFSAASKGLENIIKSLKGYTNLQEKLSALKADWDEKTNQLAIAYNDEEFDSMIQRLYQANLGEGDRLINQLNSFDRSKLRKTITVQRPVEHETDMIFSESPIYRRMSLKLNSQDTSSNTARKRLQSAHPAAKKKVRWLNQPLRGAWSSNRTLAQKLKGD